MDAFWAAPPVTRTLTALTFAESLMVHGGFLSIYRVVFLPGQIFRFPPEFWRIVTPFLLTGPRLEFLFDLYFMYTYASGLETTSPRFTKSGDFLTYVLFVCTVIMVLNFFFGAIIFTSALIMAFVHTWAQDNRGKHVTFYVIQIKAEWLPLVMLIITMVSVGWTTAMVVGTGIVASHLYDFLTRLWPTFGGGRNYIFTPSFVDRLFESRGTNARHYGVAYRAGQDASQGSSSNSWSRRGAGRRLGS